MKTIPAFLEEFGGALKLSGPRRRRVLAEAHDHLAEAKETGIKAGLEPAQAEAAAVDAFGEPEYLASRFESDFRTRTIGKVSSVIDAVDCWRSEHPVAGATSLFAPLIAVVALLWSPLAAAGFAPIWVVYIWLGRQLVSRNEPGYRRRLWTWKHENPARFNLVTGVAAVIAFAWVEGTVYFYPPSHHLSVVTLAVIAPIYLAALLLNNPKPFKPPAPTA